MGKSCKRSMAGRMAHCVELVGPAASSDLSVASHSGGGDGIVMARDRWQFVYRYGVGRSGTGSSGLGIQCGYRRSLWPWRCHGHLVSGALSGIWQKSVHTDVGTFGGIGGLALSALGQKKIQRSVDPLRSLSDAGISDPKGYSVDHRVIASSAGKKKTHPRGKVLRGSFTIEAALLIPLIFGIIFLLLQMVVTLHDRVSEEAYRYEEQCKEQEQDSWRFVQIAGAVLEEWEEWKS